MTYSNLKSIIGKRFDDPLSEEFRHRYVNNMVLDSARNMPAFLHNETQQLSIEELIAYQFQNAKQQASATAGENVKDVVITVSSFFFLLLYLKLKNMVFVSRLHHLPINMNVNLFWMQLNLQV